MPRHVALAEYDNELLVDFDNVLSVESFVHLVKSRDEAILVEQFPPPDQLAAHGPEGRFLHELAIPYVRTGSRQEERVDRDRRATSVAQSRAAAVHIFREPHVPPPPMPDATPSDRRAAAERHFPPGSEWLYAKLYTSRSGVDGLLRDLVRPLVEEALGSGAADGWFFIRYGDPDWHLRLRFHGDPERLHAELLPQLQAAAAQLLKKGTVWRLQLDTYEREVERYGGPDGILIAEQLFQADSEAVLRIVEACPDDDDGDAGQRWRLAIRGMDLLLDDLAFDLEGKLGILKAVRASYARELRVDAAVQRRLGERYRAERPALEALLNGSADAVAGELRPALDALHRRSTCLAPLATALWAAERAGRLTMPVAELAPSYLHMHVNRLLHASPRQSELVLYDFLLRVYESRAARAGSRAPA